MINNQDLNEHLTENKIAQSFINLDAKKRSTCTLKPGTTQNKRFPVSTGSQARLPAFLPVKRVADSRSRQVSIRTSWGEIIFKNFKLTQVHRNILDVIFTCYDHKVKADDGSVTFFISLRQLQKMIGSSCNNHTWLKEKLEELRSTTMILKKRTDGNCIRESCGSSCMAIL